VIRLHLMAILALCALTGGQALAQDRNCIARVNHQELIIVAGTVIEGTPDITLRERLLSWPTRTWDNAWGEAPACDSATTIAFLARMLSLDETEGYCLADAKDGTGFLLVPGERNFRGRCRTTICEHVNMVRDEGLAVAQGAASLIAGRQINSVTDGVTALASSSGAMLVTGQSSAIMSALGQTAGALTTALTAPATAAAAAVTVMTVGGAVYVCSD
jgi:hypothetical protein